MCFTTSRQNESVKKLNMKKKQLHYHVASSSVMIRLSNRLQRGISCADFKSNMAFTISIRIMGNKKTLQRLRADPANTLCEVI